MVAGLQHPLEGGQGGVRTQALSALGKLAEEVFKLTLSGEDLENQTNTFCNFVFIFM